MLFSLLIAHYNNYDLFLDCYDSIVKQSYSNFEVIILDDCSTDGSFEKLTEFLKDDARFKIYQNDSNQGVGFTKKRLAELANGEVCGFLDPDDALSKNAIENSVKNHTEKNVVTYSKFLLCDANLNHLKLFPQSRAIKNGDEKFFNIFLEANHFFTFKKSAYNKTSGINAELTSAVDQDLYLKLYEIGNFTFINEALYYYRLHEKGVSQEKSKKGKLNENWQKVILDTAKRRNIERLYGKDIQDIDNLPEFIFKNQNTFLKKIQRKLQ
ncbi:glycosyltransferase family 2 protein [Epilithonimonas vandammei]|uniref:Glycosyltransferase family 2 protein n=1 Tax=Epilithonimonas vandammei TaxID=2487072 RepID=A0A3G8ZGA6_9FLAO|nr:glycosyltransferase family A protein [Epilithonimonas vandammei]AZI55865.1 glycosyltransferase family 2 protein [Epilithonimonas vandammei]